VKVGPVRPDYPVISLETAKRPSGTSSARSAPGGAESNGRLSVYFFAEADPAVSTASTASGASTISPSMLT